MMLTDLLTFRVLTSLSHLSYSLYDGDSPRHVTPFLPARQMGPYRYNPWNDTVSYPKPLPNHPWHGQP